MWVYVERRTVVVYVMRDGTRQARRGLAMEWRDAVSRYKGNRESI